MSLPPDLSRGACVGDTNPEDWFADKNSPEEIRAREICGGCEVREACLADRMHIEGSLGRDSRHGIYGGLSGPERRALYIQRRRALVAATAPTA